MKYADMNNIRKWCYMSSLELERKLMAYVEEKTLPKMLKRMDLVGITGVDWARLHGSYKDRTGNLRNSIDYITLKEGVPTRPLKNENEIAAVNSIKEKHELDLIIFAGMNYGIFVEARGFTVLPKWKDLKYKELLQEGE